MQFLRLLTAPTRATGLALTKRITATPLTATFRAAPIALPRFLSTICEPTVKHDFSCRATWSPYEQAMRELHPDNWREIAKAHGMEGHIRVQDARRERGELNDEEGKTSAYLEKVELQKKRIQSAGSNRIAGRVSVLEQAMYEKYGEKWADNIEPGSTKWFIQKKIRGRQNALARGDLKEVEYKISEEDFFRRVDERKATMI